ncbi:MAG: hypothetical protein HKN33_06215 [Pyrinomonadaceae bacterium]|nr:hypothetical protein [Pyrinomonadaceae bacterium]
MNKKLLIFGQILAVLLCAAGIFAQAPQNEEKEKLNFGFTRNPPIKKKPRERVVKTGEKDASSKSVKAELESNAKKKDLGTAKTVNGSETEKKGPVFESVARKTREIAKEESRKTLKPTEIYKVGIDDVLFVGIEESRSSYFTVLKDGSIDYPLAGGPVPVEGLTVDEIEEVLREKITVFDRPEVSVEVREYVSHAIDVLGLVAQEGKQFLQREAMPLYVIRAQVLPKSEADQVVIKRGDDEKITINMGTREFDETLVYSGDVVEFGSSKAAAGKDGFIYIGGSVKNTGRLGFHKGMTLTQAIMAAGGTQNAKVKKAVIRRKNEKGFLKSKTHKIPDIRKGKKIDPELRAGDIIEVGS